MLKSEALIFLDPITIHLQVATVGGLLQLINLIIFYVTIQQDTVTQSLNDYFNVSKLCLKLGNSP